MKERHGRNNQENWKKIFRSPLFLIYFSHHKLSLIAVFSLITFLCKERYFFRNANMWLCCNRLEIDKSLFKSCRRVWFMLNLNSNNRNEVWIEFYNRSHYNSCLSMATINFCLLNHTVLPHWWLIHSPQYNLKVKWLLVSKFNMILAKWPEHHFTTQRNVLGLFRSSHRRCSVKKGVLKTFANFTGKHLCWNLFLITLQVFRPATLLKRYSYTDVFLRNLWNF